MVRLETELVDVSGEPETAPGRRLRAGITGLRKFTRNSHVKFSIRNSHPQTMPKLTQNRTRLQEIHTIFTQYSHDRQGRWDNFGKSKSGLLLGF